jgi:ferric-dicitrate binding protein FerR (iron transport regulator)
MEQKVFEQLVEKFLQETISAGELGLLLDEIKAGRNIDLLENTVAEKLAQKAYYGLSTGVDGEKLFNEALSKAVGYEKETAKVIAITGRQKYLPVFRVSAAAVILLVCLTGAWYLFFNKKEAQIAGKGIFPALNNDIAPGGNKATLTMADGTTVTLTDMKNGALPNQGSTKVIKLNDGQLVYNASNAAVVQTAYNTISTPRGGKYHVILPDGSNVWLNAASSIRFPTAFTGRERNVEITGEVYFEVAKNKAMPFTVKAGDAKVEVLGTHFNVMAYTDEASLKTTLLEGSVKVYQGNKAVIIKPGQQAKINSGGNDIAVFDNVDTDEVVAWKNDMFLFNNSGIEIIMRQISRWYDVEVNYEGRITTDHFTGKVSRNFTASQVLKILELSDIHFTITGKKIIVKS